MAIYLDNHSSTELAPEVRDAMSLHLSSFGNSSSSHRAGREAADAIHIARQRLADLIGADASEIIFTSGATEANNLAIRGGAKAARSVDSNRRKILISTIEHPAGLASANSLQADGFEVCRIPTLANGVADLETLKNLMGPDVCLVSVMAANNEIGTIQPLREIGVICQGYGALFHTDAAQANGRIPLDVFDLDVHYMSLSAHKMHGPQGIGALYISSSAVKPMPVLFGGDQEGGLRPGTLPTALIVGFGVAAQLAHVSMSETAQYVNQLAASFREELRIRQCRYVEIFHDTARLPGSLGICFDGVSADDLVAMLADEVLLTSGSACKSGSVEPSHVLLATGLSDVKARQFVRILFSKYNRREDGAVAAAAVAEACRRGLLATG